MRLIVEEGAMTPEQAERALDSCARLGGILWIPPGCKAEVNGDVITIYGPKSVQVSQHDLDWPPPNTPPYTLAARDL